MDLNIIWFVLIAVLFAGYAILDGFDLGVGALYLSVKGDENRRIVLNSIGPVWDGNEVWLVTGGGALFAAFPIVYATAFSGFYTAFMLLLIVLIFRAIAIEFRSKRESKRWRNVWDIAFSLSSIFIALLMGIALGNIVQGVPIDSQFEMNLKLFELFSPYSLLIGITTVSLFVMHGNIYLILKTEGELQNQFKKYVMKIILTFVALYIITTLSTLLFMPHMLDNLLYQPVLFIVPTINLLAVANIPREITHGREFRAFLSSGVSILALIALFAIGMFPNIMTSSINETYNLTLYNAASSENTLLTMLYIAIIGMPFVLAYTFSIYWVFRGKTKLDKMSY